MENLSLRQEQRDLVILKALFLIKIFKIDEGKNLLKKLIDGESNLNLRGNFK